MRTWNTLLSADEARELFARHYQPRPVPEEVDTADALGRVLAEEVRSPEDLPPFRRSLMDGYAVRSEDIRETPATLSVVADVRMFPGSRRYPQTHKLPHYRTVICDLPLGRE